MGIEGVDHLVSGADQPVSSEAIALPRLVAAVNGIAVVLHVESRAGPNEIAYAQVPVFGMLNRVGHVNAVVHARSGDAVAPSMTGRQSTISSAVSMGEADPYTTWFSARRAFWEPLQPVARSTNARMDRGVVNGGQRMVPVSLNSQGRYAPHNSSPSWISSTMERDFASCRKQNAGELT